MSIAPLLALKDGWMTSSRIIQTPVVVPFYYDSPSPVKIDGIFKDNYNPKEQSSNTEKVGQIQYNKLSRYKPLTID